MQTFLPYQSFDMSAACLDYKRLGKQRVEVLQILRALSGKSKGWASHPCTRMWQRYPRHLIIYGLAICKEWLKRGYQDTCYDKIETFFDVFDDAGDEAYPHWLGNEAFHSSHRAALLAKDPVYYRVYCWKEAPKIDYVWPTVISS